MKVELTDHTADPERTISKAAAICYDGDTSPEACDRRLKSLITKGHLSTLRFAYATFNVSGISRVCSHQLVRHAHLSYLQRSQRYCSELDIEFTVPQYQPGDETLHSEIAEHYKDCLDVYRKLIEAGYNKGEARYVLPQASTTELNITGNFQAWRDFIALRTDKAAQWEIRAVAYEIKRLLCEIAPNVFGGE